MPPLTWWLKPVNTRQILVRMNNNLQAAYLGQQDLKVCFGVSSDCLS